MKLSSLLLIAAIGAVGVGVVGEKVAFFCQPCLLGGIGVNMNVCSALALDTSPLVVSVANSISKVALADVNRNPLVLRVEFGEDVVSGLVGIEAHWNLVDVIGVAGFASSDPVAGVTHGDWLGLGWQNAKSVPPARQETQPKE